MFGRATEKAQDARGANLVEFALVLPLLLLLLAGIADLGRAFYTYISVANAAREGVRYYSRLPCITTDSVQRQALFDAVYQTTVNEAAASGIVLAPPDATIAIDPDPTVGCPGKGQPVHVEVVYRFTSMITSVPMLGGGGFSFGVIPLGHIATMVNFGNDTP